jgi:superfamily II DNA or RNA helicase
MPSLREKLRFSSVPQSVAVIYNNLRNLYFVYFAEESCKIALSCECQETPCNKCSKFWSAAKHLSSLKTCACDGAAQALHCYPLKECAPLQYKHSALRSRELAEWWRAERRFWVTAEYDENFEQESVAFSRKRSDFVAEWKTRFPKSARFAPNPIQRKVLNKLSTLQSAPRAFLFFWALGSGKTLVALLYAALFRFARVIVICSKTMISQWLETLRAAKCCAPRTLVVVVTYEKLEMLAADLDVFPHFDCAIVDECHYYKNLNDAKARSFHLLEKKFPHILLLSGTPLRHSLDELNMYARLFGVTLAQNFDSNVFARGVSFYDPSEHASDEWFYPEVNVHRIEYKLSALHTLAYLCKSGRNHRVMLEHAAYALPTWGRGDELSRNALLNQCLPFEKAPKKISAKLEVLVAKIRESAKPQVVYSMYKHFHAELLEKLAAAKYSVRVLTGDESSEERNSARVAFLQNEVDVLLLCRVGSDGLDLYTARTLHVLEPQNNDAETRQVVGRVVRGSLQPYEYGVDVYHYCCALANEASEAEVELCREFCEYYAEVGEFIRAWSATNEITRETLSEFLRAASAAENGSVEEKRERRNAENARNLARGIQYLKDADLFAPKKAQSCVALSLESDALALKNAAWRSVSIRDVEKDMCFRLEELFENAERDFEILVYVKQRLKYRVTPRAPNWVHAERHKRCAKFRFVEECA